MFEDGGRAGERPDDPGDAPSPRAKRPRRGGGIPPDLRAETAGNPGKSAVFAPGTARAFSPVRAVAVVAMSTVRSTDLGRVQMLSKILSLGLTSLLGVGLAAAFPPAPPDDGPP